MIKRVKEVLISQLSQGVTVEKITQSLVIGILIGCFPVLGFTTVLAFIFGVTFRLNHFVVQAAHFAMYPVQILLIPIYVKVISSFIDVGDVPLRPDLLIEDFSRDWVMFLKKYGVIAMYAVLMWCLGSAALFFFLQKALMPVVVRVKDRNQGDS